MQEQNNKAILQGIMFAVAACIIWSGNFVVARAIVNVIHPFTLSFFRWFTASLVILPLAWKNLKAEIQIASNHKWLFVAAALTGVTFFNSFAYIAAHYIPAINLALIGTTSSPVFAIILAKIFLKEKISGLRMLGLVTCITGILFLLGKGDLNNIRSLQFGTGDLWILAAAFTFALYNTLVKRKPTGISSIGFLTITFILGTVFLLPFFIGESLNYQPVEWNINILLVILFLGIGASVLSFFCWNAAIARLGAGRTALFGNLIPIFSSIEATMLLNESVSYVHVISFILVAIGLIIANISFKK